MDASELAQGLARQLGLTPGSFDIHQPWQVCIDGSLPIELGFVPESDHLQVAVRLGILDESGRDAAMASLMLANGYTTSEGQPHFALMRDRVTVVMCQVLAFQGKSVQAVWDELKTLAKAAAALCVELASHHFINPAR